MEYDCFLSMDIPELKDKGGSIFTLIKLPFVPYPGLWLYFNGNRAEARFRIADVQWQIYNQRFGITLDKVQPMAMMYHRDIWTRIHEVSSESGVLPEHVDFWLDFLNAAEWDIEMLEMVE